MLKNILNSSNSLWRIGGVVFKIVFLVSLLFVISTPLSAGCIFRVYPDPSGDIYYANNGINAIATQNYQDYLDWVNANCR